MTTKELIWDAMLQHIIRGMATKGSRKCSRTTPDTAEKAKPEKPETTPPRKIAIVSTRVLNSLIIQHEILRTATRRHVSRIASDGTTDALLGSVRRLTIAIRRCAAHAKVHASPRFGGLPRRCGPAAGTPGSGGRNGLIARAARARTPPNAALWTFLADWNRQGEARIFRRCTI